MLKNINKKANKEIQAKGSGLSESRDYIFKKLFTGSLLRLTSLIVSIVVAFYLMPMLVQNLGDNLYGLWSIIGYFIGYYGMLDLGISGAVARYISRAIGRRDEKEINSIAGTSLLTFIVVGIVALILTFIAANIFPSVISSTVDKSTIRNVILIMGCGISISFPMRIFYGLLVSKLRYDLFSYLEVGQVIARFILIIYFINAGHGIVALALINVIVELAGYLVQIYFVIHEYPTLNINLRQFSLKKFRQLFNYGIYTFITRLADQLRFKTSSFVIAKYIALATVTHYEVAIRLIYYYRALVMSAVNIMMPVYSRYEAKNDFNSIRKAYLISTNICVIFSCYVGFSLICYGDAFIKRWIGLKFSDSYYVAAILVFGTIIELIQIPSQNLLFGISKHRFYSKMNVVEGVINLFLCIVMVQYYGMVGIAWAANIEILIFRFVIFPIYVCKVINLSMFEYYVKTIGYTSCKMIIMMAPMLIIINKYLQPNYSSIFFFAIIQTSLAIPIIVYLVINKSERKFILTTLQSTTETAG